ncbi:MAG: phosphotransferase, partial [Moraxellaceae bacterium]
APLRTRDGDWLRPLAGKPAQLAPRLPGRHAEAPDAAQCQAVGAALAALHRALATHALARVNAHGRDWWQALAAHWQPRLPADEQALLAQLLHAHDTALARAPALPAGLIHGDLFRDNLLFTNTAVSGLLDFSECGHDHWLLDIAITMNDFCRAWPTDTPDPAREQAFLAGYAGVRALTPDEQQALPAFLAVAAMRFWLSRLDIAACNAREERGGEHVTEKDPAEMRRLAARRLAAIPA